MTDHWTLEQIRMAFWGAFGLMGHELLYGGLTMDQVWERIEQHLKEANK